MWWSPVCHGCGRGDDGPLCRPCRRSLGAAATGDPLPPLGSVWALLAHEGPGRRVVHALKYEGRRALVRELTGAMAALVRPGAYDWVTWAPTTAARRRARGFDQSRVLAAGVARATGLRLVAALDRTDSSPQTGRGRIERAAGPRFGCGRDVAGTVLLVDDVVTTGATMQAAAGTLRAAGAASVDGLALARAPLRTLSGVGPR